MGGVLFLSVLLWTNACTRAHNNRTSDGDENGGKFKCMMVVILIKDVTNSDID